MIDLQPTQLYQVIKILDKLVPTTMVWAFRSRVRDTASEHSDLDIVIIGKQKVPQKTFYQLKDAFEESDLPIRVDVLDWHRISSEFQKNIEACYIKIYPPK